MGALHGALLEPQGPGVVALGEGHGPAAQGEVDEAGGQRHLELLGEGVPGEAAGDHVGAGLEANARRGALGVDHGGLPVDGDVLGAAPARARERHPAPVLHRKGLGEPAAVGVEAERQAPGPQAPLGVRGSVEVGAGLGGVAVEGPADPGLEGRRDVLGCQGLGAGGGGYGEQGRGGERGDETTSIETRHRSPFVPTLPPQDPRLASGDGRRGHRGRSDPRRGAGATRPPNRGPERVQIPGPRQPERALLQSPTMARAPRPLAAVLLALLVVATVGAGGAPAGVRLGAHRFPAAGAHQATLTVAHTGRYRIAVTSGTGVALTLVDQMRGVVARSGLVGKTDGRLDVLLDPGAYLVRLQGDRRAEGEATLSADAFRDARPGPVPVLQAARPVATSLGDLERRAFWIDVGARGPVTVEAAGRHLEAMDLWRGGRYRVPVDARAEANAGTRGRPWKDLRLAAVLDPGRYLVTCWGGPGLPWPGGGHGAPLVVQLGVRPLPPVAVRHGKVPALGLVRYRLAPDRFPSAVSLTLDHPGDATVTVSAVTPGRVPDSAYPSGRLSKKQRHPTVLVDAQGRDPGQRGHRPRRRGDRLHPHRRSPTPTTSRSR